MFRKKKQKQKDDKINFKTDNYIMKDSYKTDNLVVANLEYVSSEVTPNGPMVKRTSQKYIFEMLIEEDEIRYRELFTGFIADEESHYFDLPYVVNVVPLKEQVPTVAETITKYALLLVLNEANTKTSEKEFQKTNNK